MPLRRALHLHSIRRNVRKEQVVYTNTDVHSALRESKWGNLSVILRDSKYRALPLNIWEKVIERSSLDRRKYKSEFFDCDDFEDVLVGEVKRLYEVNGIGHVVDWSGGHAYNVLLVDKSGSLDIAWLEPQTDQIMDTSPATGLYTMTDGLILL